MREKASARKSHGMAHDRAYRIWSAMKQRCHNPDSDGYYLYGERGIIVCEQWRQSFAAFWQDMGATYQDDLTIDRIDTNGIYEPGNCKWSTPKEQANNRRDNLLIQTGDGMLTITEAAERYGIKRRTLYDMVTRYDL